MKHKYEGDAEHVQDYARPPAKGIEHDLCVQCQRKPGAVNNDQSECSHVDCPHRRSTQLLDGFHSLKVPRVGEDPKRKDLIPDGWSAGCYKKSARFEE